MVDLSVKGIARRYRGIENNFWVGWNLLDRSSIEGSISLRSSLESMARHHVAYKKTESCLWTLYDFESLTMMDKSLVTFRWTVAYEQTWTHIRVKIRLIGAGGVDEPSLLAAAANWKTGIERVWNNKWRCGRPGENTCRLTFEVQFTVTIGIPEDELLNPPFRHHDVWIGRDIRGENSSFWWVGTVPMVAAHEFGHLIGNKDEYRDDARCRGRVPINTGTIMDDNTGENIFDVPSDMMTRFANDIGSNVVI
ncbi:MAG: hypothetical protein WA461_03170 [Nitrososphaeraceae archaeon]